MSAPDFWDNREKAQADVEEVSSLRNKIQPLESVERQIADFEVLCELAAAEDDQATAQAEVAKEQENITKALDEIEMDVVAVVAVGAWSEHRGEPGAGQAPHLLAERPGDQRVGQVEHRAVAKLDGADIERVALAVLRQLGAGNAVAAAALV